MARSTPRVLIVDIETAPILAEVWDIWEQNVGLNQIVKENNIKSIYLGYYIWWDGRKHYNFVKERGFKGREAGPLSGNFRSELRVKCGGKFCGGTSKAGPTT